MSTTNTLSKMTTATYNPKKKRATIIPEMLNGPFCRKEVTLLPLMLLLPTPLLPTLLLLTLLRPTPLLPTPLRPTPLLLTKNPQWLRMFPIRCQCTWLKFPNTQLQLMLLLLIRPPLIRLPRILLLLIQPPLIRLPRTLLLLTETTKLFSYLSK